MKKQSLILVAILGALALGILAIAGTWSAITPKPVPVAPDTVNSPNPDAKPK